MPVVAFADHAFMRNWLPLVTSADKKRHGDIDNVIYGQVLFVEKCSA